MSAGSIGYYPIFIEDGTILDILHFNMMTALDHGESGELANRSYNQSVEFLMNLYSIVQDHLQHIPNLPYDKQDIYLESFITTDIRFQLKTVFRDLMMGKIYEDGGRFRYDRHYDLGQYYNTFSTFKAHHNYGLGGKFFINYEYDLTPYLTHTEDCVFKFRRTKYRIRPLPHLKGSIFASDFSTLRQRTYYDYQNGPGLYGASNYYGYQNIGETCRIVGNDGFKIYGYEHFGSVEILMKVLFSYFGQISLPEHLAAMDDPTLSQKFFFPTPETDNLRGGFDPYKPNELYFIGPKYNFHRLVQRSGRREMFDRDPFDFDSF